MSISAVVNAYNEEKNIDRCLRSLWWVDEIVVVDMESQDSTIAKAKKYTKLVFTHRFTGYVEPARNFAISKASGDWILIVDADEEIPKSLQRELLSQIKNEDISFYRLPRKNIVFGRFIHHGLWWPDYQIRFFRTGSVEWREEIHSVPYTHGEGKDLLSKEEFAIIHHHYSSIAEYLERINRYTDQQAKEQLKQPLETFKWQQILTRPIDEFLRRYFLAEGFKDGLHGLTLAFLQAFSEFVFAIKLWEEKGFKSVDTAEIKDAWNSTIEDKSKEVAYWLNKSDLRRGIRGKIASLFR